MKDTTESIRASLITIIPASDFAEYGGLDVHIEFECPNCGYTHTMLEHVVYNFVDFNEPGWQLPCGWVQVSLPWPSAMQG